MTPAIGAQLCLLILPTLLQNGAAQTNLNDGTTNFLTQFFNLTIEEIGYLANNFEYVNVSTDDVNFLLYQPGSDVPTELSKDALNFEDTSKHIIGIIHGWTDNGELPWIKKMARDYYEVNSNRYIFAVDWRGVANGSYFTAATAVQSVGSIAARFLWAQLNENVDRLQNVHIIGHSLGAQTSGFLGKKIQELSGNKLDRITALEPAGPLFTTPISRPTTLRIANTDANFVNGYHTSIHLEGQASPCGQIDIYWNCGGPIQPGCQNISTISDLLEPASCSHQTVHDYFIDTIKNGEIYPTQACDLLDFNQEVVYSGEYITRNTTGKFCGSTETQKPQKCVIVYIDLLN